jgi:prevent-host-death family protein
MSHMDRIGVRELRQNASKYLKRVESGETIEVADRGRLVARIVPVTRSGLDGLIVDGRASLPTGDALDVEPVLLLPEAPEPSEIVSRMRDE